MRRLKTLQCTSRTIIALLLLATTSGCALPYYWQAIGGQIELMRKRRPIDSVIEDPRFDAELREALANVAELREFAVESLQLPDNDSYRTYVDVGRSYVVWNVIATNQLSIDPVEWCYPFAGCVNYRGYFDRADAQRFQRRLDAQGLDTYSGGSGAYSTLGYFSDPVLNTMLHGDPAKVAAILFHELAHQKVYVQHDSDLSEAFATAVEEYGVEMWLRRRGDGQALESYLQRIARRAQFAELVSRQQVRLRTIFKSNADDEAKLEAKAASFELMQAEYDELKQQWGGANDYDGWFSRPLNNATLVAIATYRRWLPALKWRLAEVGLTRFYEDVAMLAALPDEKRRRQLEQWDSCSSAPGGLSQLVELRDAAREVTGRDGVHRPRHDSECGETVLVADARH